MTRIRDREDKTEQVRSSGNQVSTSLRTASCQNFVAITRFDGGMSGVCFSALSATSCSITWSFGALRRKTNFEHEHAEDAARLRRNQMSGVRGPGSGVENDAVGKRRITPVESGSGSSLHFQLRVLSVLLFKLSLRLCLQIPRSSPFPPLPPVQIGFCRVGPPLQAVPSAEPHPKPLACARSLCTTWSLPACR